MWLLTNVLSTFQVNSKLSDKSGCSWSSSCPFPPVWCRFISLNMHPKPSKRVEGHLFIINLFKFTKAACFLLGRGKSPLQAVLTFQQGLPQPLPEPHSCWHITAAYHSKSKHRRSLSNRPVISPIVKKTSYSKISSTFIAYHIKNYLIIFTTTWKKEKKKSLSAYLPLGSTVDMKDKHVFISCLKIQKACPYPYLFL